MKKFMRGLLMYMRAWVDKNMKSGVRERQMMTGRVRCKLDNNMRAWVMMTGRVGCNMDNDMMWAGMRELLMEMDMGKMVSLMRGWWMDMMKRCMMGRVVRYMMRRVCMDTML